MTLDEFTDRLGVLVGEREKLMNAIKELVATSVDELLDVISAMDWKFKWYRGHSRKEYKLLPSIFRPRENGSILNKKHEKLLCQRFQERSSLLISRTVDDKVSMLLLMQHYGIPTRLLDWSDSLSVALSFALEEYNEEPTIWVLNATVLNGANDSYGGSTMPDSFHSECCSYARYAFSGRTIAASSKNNMLPLAFKPIYPEPRMHIQRSRFTIHGTSSEPLETQVGNLDDASEIILWKIIIKLGSKRKSLDRLKLDNSMLYPDREGLVRRLREEIESDPKLLGASLVSEAS